MSNHGITAENLLRTLPDVLRSDKKTAALASAIANILAARTEEIDRLKLYRQIDNLPETLLDILADDFKVDWWDYNYTLEEKRKTLKDSWNVHRTLGTKGAVEKAISAIYPGTEVREWFEYAGQPYHFKLLIDATYQNVDSDKHQRVLERIEYYKNLRSHLDGIEYTAVPSGYCTSYGAAAFVGYSMEIAAKVNVFGLNEVSCRSYGGVALSGMTIQLDVEVDVNGMG